MPRTGNRYDPSYEYDEGLCWAGRRGEAGPCWGCGLPVGFEHSPQCLGEVDDVSVWDIMETLREDLGDAAPTRLTQEWVDRYLDEYPEFLDDLIKWRRQERLVDDVRLIRALDDAEDRAREQRERGRDALEFLARLARAISRAVEDPERHTKMRGWMLELD